MTENDVKYKAGQEELFNVDEYKFQPIKGFPMLNWRGKRPFTSTQYYPAQLKEIYGKEVDGWRNKIYWGDNLQVMSHLLKEYRGKIDLIYIDPPFDSNADYKKRIQIEGKEITNDQNAFEEKQYTDIWTNDAYLQFMYDRLILLRELMTKNGNIFLHCDQNKNHHLRCLLDEVFGSGNFINEIIREKSNPKNYTRNAFGYVHDTIFFYSKNPNNMTWNKIYEERTDQEILDAFPIIEKSSGRRYKTRPVHAPGIRRGETGKKWRDMMPPPGKHWQYLPSKLEKFDSENRVEWSSTGNPRLKVYADESLGVFVQSIWGKMKDSPKTGYPTEKNDKLVERIILAGSNPGDLILDCFMGSGTAQVVAMKLGRKFIGSDINFGAIQTSIKRLQGNITNSKSLNDIQIVLKTDNDPHNELKYFPGFEIYNVNNYDIFRNPIEAKELLLNALEITPLRRNQLFDGEKDGRMVKIMPINRLASKADLNEIISGFDYKSFEKRKISNPNLPVETITLVCMGHEPDLSATLENEILPYKIDVEVVDILRDKQDLIFKRDSEAEINIQDNRLFIEQFYPMNLLQKLSLQKEKVKDWRELVESVMVDWNYDGAVLQPATVDIPEKNEFVKGNYKVPEEAGTIRIKITDLLSESFEMDVQLG